MREIKFRGRHLSGQWYYGNLIRKQTEYIIYDIEDGSAEDVEEETVGQFTGLYDKNGKEIYEGDIIGDNNVYYIIIYNQLEARFTAKYINNGKLITENCQAWFNESNKIIVGNIYDNPEFDEK